VIKNQHHVPTILVIGDYILDEYIWTQVHRVSPEAPVPVCHIQSYTHCLGGGGNVSHNLSVFGANVVAIGIIGNDANGKILQDKLKKAGISLSGMVTSNKVSTIKKSRVMARRQQLCRLDTEITPPNLNQCHAECLRTLQGMSNVSAIVISDYNKGMITESFSQRVIDHANQRGVPIIVDPKGHSPKKYKGATYITPNVSEFCEMAGIKKIENEDHLIAAATALIKELNIQIMVLTRSEDGMSVITASSHHHYPTKAVEVSDVTGAGDTVVAAIAYGAALKWAQEGILNFANYAAGVVVSKIGTATATLQEIKRYESHF
jgi:rfaE bifunctional protein kinase chain/domain